jgi:hypothetical protein
MPIFYGTQEDENKLQKAYNMFTALFDKSAVGYYDEYSNKFATGYNSRSYVKNGGTEKKSSILFIVLATNNVKYMEYCKKAYKPDEFHAKMLYRKEDKVKSYFQTYDLKSAWDGIDEMYKCKGFAKVSSKWGNKVKEVADYLKTLPTITGNENIGYMKAELSNYFDLSNLKMTADQKKIAKLIDEVKKLQRDNHKIMEYIRLPYGGELENTSLIDVLQKVMAL